MKKKLLFVDDQPEVLHALNRMLREQEHVWEMRFVSSADEALAKTDATAFDLVVSDVKMAGKDGFELLKALRGREKTQDVPVIMLTGLGDSDLKRRALDLGATDLLMKPVDPEDLLARVRSVLQLKSYQDQLKSHNELLEQRVKERTAALEESRREIIWRLAKAGEHRDETTGNHIARVAWYCRIISEGLGLDREFVETITLTSPLHDIGKIGIPDTILLKKGPLTPEERAVMKTHCRIGADILSQAPKAMSPFRELHAAPRLEQQETSPILSVAVTIAEAHHERWDGTGYPKGLAGDSIPLEARIVGLADVFDALNSPRPYKPAYEEAKVLAIMRSENGKHFDPDVFAAFQDTLADIRSMRDALSDETSTGATVAGATP